MSLDYQKLKAKHGDDGSFWTSYSDLFMVLCVVFLLLYVVASLRSGTSSVQNQIENQKLKSESEDLKKQIQAYNALKDDYLEKEASPEEAQMYEDLMSKLSLLQEEANEEKKQLQAKAEDNAQKARALNQYQQMVRNIVNTNLLSNKKIKVRNELIVKKNDEMKVMDSTIQTQAKDIGEKTQLIAQQERDIEEKQKVLESKKNQINSLEEQISQKAKTIESNQTKISELNNNLSGKIKELQKTSGSKAELDRKIIMMKLDNAKKVSELKAQTQNMQAGLATINAELAQAENQLQDAKGKIAAQEEAKKKLESEMAQANADHQKSLADVKKLKDEVGSVKSQADDFKKKLADAQKDHGRYLAAIDQLEKDKQGLSGDLKRAQELANAKKALAKKIADNLARQGIKAGVDGKTGDVTINFGDEYFDTGKSDLKPHMKSILQKFVPTYSKSLLEDEKVAKEISSVEIIGFSSPTYQGRYVDPQSLDQNDRAAVAYNLDLSFHRAKSIFNYIFNKNNMTYQHQKNLLPLVKVTGRSFLAEEVKGRNIASGLSHNDYCAKYSCQKSQKVIIKFNLKD